MALHRGHEHLGRQAHVLVLNRPDDHARPFDQVDDLFDLAERIAPDASAVTGRRVERSGDRGPALAVIGHNAHGTDGVAVSGRGRDRRGPTDEPVPAADVTCGQAVQLERDRAVVELRDDPADRAREPKARAVAPAHRLTEPDALNDAFGDVGHQLVDRPCLPGDLGEDHVATIAPRADDQVFDRNTLLARKAHGRLGGLAVGVERGRRRGS